MAHTLGDMKRTLMQVADVRSCTQRHPWLVTGSAVAAGFVTSIALTPSTSTETKHAGLNAESPPQPVCEEREPPRPKKSVLFSIAGAVLASILQTVVRSSIVAAVETPGAGQKLKRGRRRVAGKDAGTIAHVEPATRKRR